MNFLAIRFGKFRIIDHCDSSSVTHKINLQRVGLNELSALVKQVYIDTSVVGGCFDDAFEFWTKMFFDSVKKGDFILAISGLFTQELKFASKHIRTFLDHIP